MFEQSPHLRAELRREELDAVLVEGFFPEVPVDARPQAPRRMGLTTLGLPYPADALEAAIDKMTMEIHHGRHHKAYVDNLNAALQGHDALLAKPIDKLMREIAQVPEALRQKVINNGGGHANHTMFWQIMGPGGGGKPTGPLADAINQAFGDFGAFQSQLKQAGLTRFGSGWGWLSLDKEGQLVVHSTANQDSPLSEGLVPLLTCDVWEHAYMVDHKAGGRAAYIDAFLSNINWQVVENRYKNSVAKLSSARF